MPSHSQEAELFPTLPPQTTTAGEPSDLRSRLLERLKAWIGKHTPSRKPLPRGTVCAALIVIERLREQYPRAWDSLLSPKQGQLRGCGGEAIQEIVARFGYHRHRYCNEGGRTNRRQLPAARALFDTLTAALLANIPESERQEALHSLQKYIYETKIRPWYQQQGLEVSFNDRESSATWCDQILHAARAHESEGTVAQHLIGAALSISCPEESISDEPVSASDSSTGREGDFQVGAAVFHVTVAPTKQHIAKCEENISIGLRPVVITLSDSLLLAQRFADELEIASRVGYYALPQFVAQTLDAQADFAAEKRLSLWGKFLAEYNRRIEKAEENPGLNIAIPKWMQVNTP